MNSISAPPLLFIFGKIIEFDFEDLSEETRKYNEQLEAEWFAFWATKGDGIVNTSWSYKYSEYLLKEEAEERQEEANEKVEERRQKNTEEKLCETEIEELPWQEIWDEHYTEVSSKAYQIFSIAHYNQYRFYRRNVKDLFEEVPPVSKKPEFVDQTEQLQALGLPSSFGGKNNKFHNSRLNDSCSETEEEKLEFLDQPDQLQDLSLGEKTNKYHILCSESESGDEMAPTEKQTPDKQAKKKKKNGKLSRIPKVILENKSLRTYWHKRFSLFSRFDEGIQLDGESWFSVTPEKVAIHMAERLRCDTIIDAFCGSGGNAIQFAFTCSKVIAIDIDEEKIKNARHNALIYGVANKIEFIIGDYLQLCGGLKGDVVFLSPPWGGPKYNSKKEYDIEESLTPLGASALAEKSKQITENIAFFLPRNSNPKQMAKLAGVGKRVEIEHNYLGVRLVGLTAIYGDWLIDKNNLNDK